MNVTKKFSRTLLSCSIAAALALAGARGFAADVPAAQPAQAPQTAQSEGHAAAQTATPVIDHDAVARYPGWESPGLMRIAVHSGRAVLHELRSAREAIDQGDIPMAREDLAAAGAFMGTIRGMTPYTVVVNRFSNADDETLGTTSRIVRDDMLPIYSDVQTMAAFDVEKTDQVKDDKTGGDGTAGAARSDEPDGISAGNEKVDEVGADIAASTLYLPVPYVSSHIDMARRALARDKPDLESAREALNDALDGLVQTTVDLHMLPQPGPSGNGSPAKPGEAQGAQGQS